MNKNVSSEHRRRLILIHFHCPIAEESPNPDDSLDRVLSVATMAFGVIVSGRAHADKLLLSNSPRRMITKSIRIKLRLVATYSIAQVFNKQRRKR